MWYTRSTTSKPRPFNKGMEILLQVHITRNKYGLRKFQLSQSISERVQVIDINNPMVTMSRWMGKHDGEKSTGK